ncbi:MAG: GPW/gp25 family protein [Burkholderiaceae bacterium]
MQLPSKRGLTFPLEIVNGGLAVSTDLDLVREHIVSVILTRPFERVMRLDYGMPDQVFSVIQPEIVDAKIAAAIEREVTEIEDLRVQGEWYAGEDGLYNVNIYYTVDGIPQPVLELSLVA